MRKKEEEAQPPQPQRPKVFHQEDIDRAVAEERARVVAQLRETADSVEGSSILNKALLAGIIAKVAADIERGV